MDLAQELFEAVKAGDAVKVKKLLETEPALVNSRNEAGESVILVAVYYGHKQVVELLLTRGVELDLFEASAVGQVERVWALLEKKTNLVHTYSQDGWTPLHLAAYFGRKDVAEALLLNGADIHTKSKNNMDNMPLHAAVAGRQRELVELLLANGAGVNSKAGGGWTPLHLAAHEGVIDILRLILSSGADVNATNNEGETPLETAVATRENHKEITDLLRQHRRTV